MELYSLLELKNSSALKLYNHAKTLIPGGTQLLSKRPEMFAPNVWPSYYSKAKGCEIWDLEGRKFIDMSIMSVGACILGYADDEVDESVIKSIRDGVSSSLNNIEEVKLAEMLLNMHPWFQMVRYARSGGEAMNIAVRISRAYTNRDLVLFSGYHGWNDWYLSSNLNNDKNLDGQLMPGLQPNGIPRGLTGTAIPFENNSIESIYKNIKNKEKDIAAIIIEPARGEEASINYLKKLRELASELGAVLIFDEITTGFRMCEGGIHRKYKIYPDIAVFAKAMSNGYAMSAILGHERVMQAAQTTFISSTNWTDRIGPTAAMATLKKYKLKKVDNHLIRIGNKVKEIWRSSAKAFDLDIKISGLPTLAAFSFYSDNDFKMSTRFSIEMLKRGFLGFRQFKPSYSHDDDVIKKYESAIKEVFKIIKNDPESVLLDTPVQHMGFTRLTKE
jgi:glutamate-1-semialdehyde 2,1-aminomutase